MNDYVKINHLTKSFGSTVAVSDVSFSIKKGEFFTFLGPSGCGKTTLLRCIAGYEIAESGQILIGDTDIRDIPPNRRDIGFGFQSYALFPTMTVFKNIAFGLEMRKVAPAEIKKKVMEMIDFVGLSGMEGRKPKQLSGGQQQRVALGRALVIQPRILLLDEPLSNLDAKLRVEMRVNITRIQKKLNITTIYVTHDQEEAFAVSDRIMVMKNGVSQQIDVPAKLYYQPANEFVAKFIGQTNLIKGQYIQSDADSLVLGALGTRLRAPKPADFASNAFQDRLSVTVRPEHIVLNPQERFENTLSGVVTERQFQGAFIAFYIQVEGTEIIVKKQGLTKDELDLQPREGDAVQLGFTPDVCAVTL
jgi:iron(III) transport system ATP-binding protein